MTAPKPRYRVRWSDDLGRWCAVSEKPKRSDYVGYQATPQGKYRTFAYRDGRLTYIGTFKTPEGAIAARDHFCATGEIIRPAGSRQRRLTAPAKSSKSGLLGVRPEGDGWLCYGCDANGKRVYVGKYETSDEAARAREHFQKTGEKLAGSSRKPRALSGYLGVSFYKHSGKWAAHAPDAVTGKRVYLGTFLTPEAANAARLAYIATGVATPRQKRDRLPVNAFERMVVVWCETEDRTTAEVAYQFDQPEPEIIRVLMRLEDLGLLVRIWTRRKSSPVVWRMKARAAIERRYGPELVAAL